MSSPYANYVLFGFQLFELCHHMAVFKHTNFNSQKKLFSSLQIKYGQEILLKNLTLSDIIQYYHVFWPFHTIYICHISCSAIQARLSNQGFLWMSCSKPGKTEHNLEISWFTIKQYTRLCYGIFYLDKLWITYISTIGERMQYHSSLITSLNDLNIAT